MVPSSLREFDLLSILLLKKWAGTNQLPTPTKLNTHKVNHQKAPKKLQVCRHRAQTPCSSLQNHLPSPVHDIAEHRPTKAKKAVQFQADQMTVSDQENWQVAPMWNWAKALQEKPPLLERFVEVVCTPLHGIFKLLLRLLPMWETRSYSMDRLMLLVQAGKIMSWKMEEPLWTILWKLRLLLVWATMTMDSRRVRGCGSSGMVYSGTTGGQSYG